MNSLEIVLCIRQVDRKATRSLENFELRVAETNVSWCVVRKAGLAVDSVITNRV